MDITPLIPADRQVIDSYGPGRFRVASTLYEGAVIVLPDRTLVWDATDSAGLTIDHFAPILGLEQKPEVLLLGTGARMALLSSALRRELRAAGIVVDVMDSPAACRTYNILLAEARRVAAALLPV